jgi:hypothetical protein
MIILPRDDLEKQPVLSKVAQSFEKDRLYTEQEVSDLIKSLDVDDYVLFRRELVNFNYFGKDSYKGIYWIKTHELSEEALQKIARVQSKIKEF